MFTGLIERMGRLTAMEGRAGGRVVRVTAGRDFEVAVGDSVSVQGVCLTVAHASMDSFDCDVLDETISRSTIGLLSDGALVNLERALRAGDRLGGHIVTGHVDGIGTVASVVQSGRDHAVRVKCSAELLAGIVMKGSIAVDGISLTVSALLPDAFEASIIPGTWENTSLRNAAEGVRVNIETDILGKYAARRAECAATDRASEGLTMDALARAGFMG